MSCITKGNTRCTKCCEAIHVPKGSWKLVSNSEIDDPNRGILEYWTRITKRQAKKINPYIFLDKNAKKWLTEAEYYTCKALVKNIGCSIRNTKDHPDVCKIYEGEQHGYSPTCQEDINIIARSM